MAISKMTLAALALVLAVGMTAQAQTDVDCPQDILDQLDDQFPGENRGRAAGDCQSWKHGIGDTSTNRNFSRGMNDPRCGFPNDFSPLFGQYIFVEPKDTVCDPFNTADSGGRCPIAIGGDGPTDAPENRTFLLTPDKIITPFFQIVNAQAISTEGTIGFRMDCASGPPANVDPAECGAGQTAIVLDDGFTTGDPGVDPGKDFRFQQNLYGNALTEGNALCCDSIDNITCTQIAMFDEYPLINRPIADVIINRPDTPPFIFTGGRGTGWEHSQTYTVPGQLYGRCLINPDVECNLTNLPVSDPCPSIGDTCNLAEEGFRAGLTDLNADGSPNPGRCIHNQVSIRGSAIDAVSGRSTGCAIGGFFAAADEGDPLPGCQIQNFGTFFRPDLDCDGVEDDTNGNGSPGPDLCPRLAEIDTFADSNGDGLGDECQCGDGNGDGAITGLDIGAIALCANSALACDSSLTDADGDVATTAQDIGGIVATVNGLQTPADLRCARNP